MAENGRNSCIHKCCSTISSSDWIQKCQLLAGLMNMHSTIAKFLFPRKLPIKFLQFFIRCDLEHCACNMFCILSKSISRKESGVKGKKKQKRKKKNKKGKEKEERMETECEEEKPIEMEAHSEKNSVLYRCSSCPLTKWSLSC